MIKLVLSALTLLALSGCDISCSANRIDNSSGSNGKACVSWNSKTVKTNSTVREIWAQTMDRPGAYFQDIDGKFYFIVNTPVEITECN